jgi:hypothetical protein
MALTQAEQKFLAQHRLGRLATTGQAPPFPGAPAEIIRIHPRRVLALNVDPNQPGLRTRDLEAVV